MSELDDLFGDSDSTDRDSSGQPDGESKNMADLRKWAKQQEKRAIAAEKQVEKVSQLEAQIADFRTADKARAVQSFGLSEKQAQLYLKVAGNDESEVTKDSVIQFVKDFGIAAELKADEGTSPPADEDKGKEFTPKVGISEGRSASTVSKMPHDEWLALNRTDRDRALQLLIEGKVDTSEVDALAP